MLLLLGCLFIITWFTIIAANCLGAHTFGRADPALTTNALLSVPGTVQVTGRQENGVAV